MNQTLSITTTGATEIRPKAKAPVSRKTLLSVGAAVLVAAGGAAYILAPKAAETTDAAYLEADSSVIAPKVRGLVADVLVQHNQTVHRGDPLVRIDPEEFDARAASANADVADAEAAVASAKAALTQQSAEEALAGANIRAARTLIQSTDAEAAKTAADRRRFDALAASGAVSTQEIDQAKAAALSAGSAADHSRAALDVAQTQASVTAAKRSVLAADLAKAEAGLGRARATVDLARQDQGHTLIRAPIDGVVGDRQAEPGDYVQPGTRLLTLVPLNALYVTANFKETQIGRMTVGQSATVKVDALPGVKLHGTVDSFAPGSGSQFSLLPFEPGVGNFTKIVQRVPVRIRLDPAQPALTKLRPGLSTTVTISLRGG